MQAKARRCLASPSQSDPKESPDGSAPSDEDHRASSLEQKLRAQGIDTFFDPLDEPNGLSKDEEETTDESFSRLALRPSLSEDAKASFLTRRGSRQHAFACYILRDRSRSKNYPSYYLYAEDGGTFLLSARRRKKSASSNYLISLAEKDLSRSSPHYFGKVRSNFIGTQFMIYDNGEKAEASTEQSCIKIRSELGAVLYEHNILGTRGPRKMTAIVPRTNAAANAVADAVKTVGDDAQPDTPDVYTLLNKAPRWNDQLNAYCLNFKGRVTEASVKNFQLVQRDDPDRIILQFGKVLHPALSIFVNLPFQVGKDRFNVDYTWPVSALQAFAICLTAFDSKLACE